MNHVRRITVVAASLLSLVLALLTVAPAAYAVRLPPDGGPGPTPDVAAIPTAATSTGLPTWEAVVIAIAAAALASALTGRGLPHQAPIEAESRHVVVCCRGRPPGQSKAQCLRRNDVASAQDATSAASLRSRATGALNAWPAPG